MQSKRKIRASNQAIGWDRARAIFQDPQPPRQVWQSQFDGFDNELQRLAQTPHEEIDFHDLWYYHHDLAYVDLQPDLFAYLFPACLMDWHVSLKNNEPCSHGDSEFHYGVHHGNILERMLSPRQQLEVSAFLRDSFLERLDDERGFDCAGADAPAHGWIHRFNSLGLVLPKIDDLWDAWWSIETPGRAVAVLEYCSGLVYLENPHFGTWTSQQGGGGPYLWDNDSLLLDVGWKPENADFLTATLTPNYVNEKIAQAIARLKSEPVAEQARQLEADLSANQDGYSVQDLIAMRCAELPALLSESRPSQGWSV